MKKGFVLFLIAVSFALCCAFSVPKVKLKKGKPALILTTSPVINQNTTTVTENIFKVGDRVNFMFYYPEGFGDTVLRMTIYKLSDKTNTLGYEPVRSRHLPVVLGDKYYYDYFVIYQPGIYQLQFVESRKPRKIMVWARFKVL